MGYLLDTHSFIWFFEGDDKLSDSAKAVIKDLSNPVFVSTVNVWEISIKQSIGKLQLKKPLEAIVDNFSQNDISLLDIKLPHALKVKELHFHHKDPFDRMLIAQAIVEQLKIISVDKVFDAYTVERVW